MQKHCIKSSSNICFGYLLESPHRGDSNKYPKHMFYEEVRIKQGLSYILFCPLRILHNSKFIIMATFMGTNAVVVMRVQCIVNSFFHVVAQVLEKYDLLTVGQLLTSSVSKLQWKNTCKNDIGQFWTRQYVNGIKTLKFLNIKPLRTGLTYLLWTVLSLKQR